MKATELIAQLQKIVDEHGDIDLFMEIEEGEYESYCGEVHGLKFGESFMGLRKGLYLTNNDNNCIE